MADANQEPITQECVACGALIDVSEEEPLALRHCTGCGMAMRVRTQFEHFTLLETLGSGGMGSVFRALDTHLNRTVALKLLRPEHMANPEILAQFEKEAAITASINHPHVVKVFSAGTDHGLFYIAMELVDRGSLDDLMNLQGRVPEAQVLDVGIQIAQGLEAACHRGLMHRDVKPGNILFADSHTAKIVDFGLAALVGHAGQMGGEVWGTPYYVAPEKLETPPEEDFRSDMYSLGASLFHAIAGRPPFEAEDASIVVLKRIKSQPVSLQSFAPEISGATAYVINKMLLKDPHARHRSYGELIEHLQFARDELLKTTGGERDHARDAILASAEKRMSWTTFALVALAMIVAVLAFLFRDRLFLGDRTPILTSTPPPVTLESRYQSARKLLLEPGPAAAERAAEAFHELDRDGVSQPMRNWISLHAGLAQLLAGHPAESGADFRKIEERGLSSEDPTEGKMATFFNESARLAESDKPIPASIAGTLSHEDHDAFALLLYAVKDWTRGDIDEAGPLFREFDAAAPEGRHRWIAEYKPLAASYLADFTIYRSVLDRVEQAGPGGKKAALSAVEKALGQLRLQSQANARLAALKEKLGAEIVAEERAAAMKLAEQEAADAADAAALAELRSKVDAHCRQFHFAEAHAAAVAARCAGEKWKDEFAFLLTKMEWLANFKRTLIADIARFGYAGGLVKGDRNALPGAVKRATDTLVEVEMKFGKVQVQWTDVAVDCIALMAGSFIRPNLGAEQIADRQWLLGIFSLTVRREAEARALLEAASGARPEYRAALPVLINR